MKLMIGLDMGEHCGFAVKEYHRNYEKLISLETFSFWDCVAKVSHIFDQNETNPKYESVMVVIEDVTQNKPVFGLEDIYKKTIGNHFSKLSVIAKIGQNVGSVKEKTRLMINYCEDSDYPTHLVVPHKGGTTKKTALFLKQLTGWDAKTDEHQIDAAMMIWGLNK